MKGHGLYLKQKELELDIKNNFPTEQQVVDGRHGALWSGEPEQDPNDDTLARLTLRALWVFKALGWQRGD